MEKEIKEYLQTLSSEKRTDLVRLIKIIEEILPDGPSWFFDRKKSEGHIVSNPNLGFGKTWIKKKTIKPKLFYQVGISSNISGISIYLMGLNDQHFLPTLAGTSLKNARVSSYCIKFKKLDDLNLNELSQIIQVAVQKSKIQ
jgi:hypothetical protein